MWRLKCQPVLQRIFGAWLIIVVNRLLWHCILHFSALTWRVFIIFRVHLIAQICSTRALGWVSHRCWSKRSHVSFTSILTSFLRPRGWVHRIPLLIYRFRHRSLWWHQLSRRIISWRYSDIPKIARWHVSTGSWCLEAGGPLRAAFITKRSRGDCLVCRDWLETHGNIARVLMITRTWKLGGFHHVRRNFNFFTYLCCSWSFEVWDRVITLLVKFADFFVSAWSWIIVLSGHVVIVEEVNFIAKRKTNCRCSKRFLIDIIQGTWVAWVRICFLFGINNCLSKVLTACTKAVCLVALLESGKPRKASNILIRIEKWRNRIRIWRWPNLFWVARYLETVSNTHIGTSPAHHWWWVIAQVISSLQIELWESALFAKGKLAIGRRRMYAVISSQLVFAWELRVCHWCHFYLIDFALKCVDIC